MRISERNVCIPTRDFFDEVKDSKQEVEIKVWITRHDNAIESTTFCRLEPEVIEVTPKKPPEEKVESEDTSVNLENKACCYTCDHARMQYVTAAKSNLFWCRRMRWPRILRHDFETEFSHYRCAEWRGEYYDIYRNCWTDKVKYWQ